MKHAFYLFIKRTLDIIASLAALMVLAPVFLLIAIAIKLESKGPVFYKGIRLGLNKHRIVIYKFRTMCVDAEARLDHLLKTDKQAAKQWQTYQKLDHDPRITKVGDFLRKTSLDELPQFFCILKGDLSLVGPRTYIEKIVKQDAFAKYQGQFDNIFSVKPGLTCLWQISGRNSLTHQDRIFLDSLYSKQKSLRKDLAILFKTVPVVLGRGGAR